MSFPSLYLNFTFWEASCTSLWLFTPAVYVVFFTLPIRIDIIVISRWLQIRNKLPRNPSRGILNMQSCFELLTDKCCTHHIAGPQHRIHFFLTKVLWFAIKKVRQYNVLKKIVRVYKTRIRGGIALIRSRLKQQVEPSARENCCYVTYERATCM